MYTVTSWAALGISLIFTTIVWLTILDLGFQTQELEFNSITEQATQQIIAKLKTHEQVLMGFEGLFSASQLVEPVEFTNFYNIQKINERFPDNQGVGYIEYVNGDIEKTELVQRLQNNGIDFNIYPEGQRLEYYPVVFLEPQDFRNERAIGFDVNSENLRQQAIIQARESGMITLTGKIILVQETEENVQNGFLMLLPVYQYFGDSEIPQEFQGFVYAVFRMDDFIKGTLDASLFEAIEVEIYDDILDQENLFFDSKKFGPIVNEKIFSSSYVVDFGGRHWLLDFQGAIPKSNIEQNAHWIVPIAGYSMSFLLFYTLVLFSKNSRLTENMLKKEKITVVGEISSRFAHDIRNPLSNIQMSIDLLQKDAKLQEDEKVKEKFLIISKNLERISRQVDDVLGFVRSRQPERNAMSLKECLTEALDSLKIPKNIKISFPSNDITILGDYFQLQIVFKNLINNAIQSIGKIEGRISIRLIDKSSHAIIEIEDTGPGFSKINLEEIFEPLTTTKQTGIGLGLVSCKQIIENHNGLISAKGNPTIFTIKLPRK